MAAQKPTLVSSLAFSTILNACGTDQVLRKSASPAEQDTQFKQTPRALSLHLHGDLQ